jgi:hypothetical protein
MKRLFLFIGAVVVLASSCVSTTVWDETYPPEKSATIWFYGITVKSYNGIGVEPWFSVVIPAGETSIGGDVRIGHAGITFEARDMEFTCYLEPEKEYTISGAAKDGQWGVNLYEGKALSGTALFIPFTQQPDSFN